MKKYKVIAIIVVAVSLFLYGMLVSKNYVTPYSHIMQVSRHSKSLSAKEPLDFDAMLKCVQTVQSSPVPKTHNYQYTFFVAGHAYGSPKENRLGIYPKFYSDIAKKSKHGDVDFGVFTGDIVRYSTLKYWGVVKEQLKQLSIKTYIAPGNHDIGTKIDSAMRDVFKMVNGDSYYSFYKETDLFIVLDPNISGWDIDGEQLEFLRKVVADNNGRGNNIFIFMHQVIWSDKQQDALFRKIKPNSLAGKKSKSTNYWSTIAPMLEQQSNPVYMLSGDVGAFDNGSELFCAKQKNITYIASGMGGGARDNYLLFTVTNSSVSARVELLP